MVRLGNLAAGGGVAGPVLFTAAWVVSSLRQAGHPAAGAQLSGLAAQDARDPQIMIAGFVVLGACTAGFGAALRKVAGPRAAGPWLVMAAGAAAAAAGVFRRDHLLLAGQGFAGESWHNQVHDVVSGVAYAAMLAAPLALARRFRADPQWAGIARPVQVLAVASLAAMAVFASRAVEPWNGTVQRAAVTLALAAEVFAAARMLTVPETGAGPPTGPAASPGHRPATTRRRLHARVLAEDRPPPERPLTPAPGRHGEPDREPEPDLRHRTAVKPGHLRREADRHRT